MTQAIVTHNRNESMEYCKFFAAVCVAVSHVGHPGSWITVVSANNNLMVAMFFAISGYFSFGASSGKLAKRLWHILKLNVIADCIHILFSCLAVELEGGSTVAYLITAIPDPQEIALLLLVQSNPFLGHLWTLACTAMCYGALWLYTRFWEAGAGTADYRPLYTVCAVLLFVFTGIVAADSVIEVELSYLIYRNFWFWALPCFTLGIFIRQYGEQLMAAFRLTGKKLLAGVLSCILLTVLMVYGGVSGGILIELLGCGLLMLLFSACPRVTRNGGWLSRMAPRFGFWSMPIYIVHITLLVTYERLFADSMTARFGPAEPWLRILVILAASFAAALIWEQLARLRKK